MVLQRLVWLFVGAACWALCVLSILTLLSWLVRRPFIYAGTMRELDAMRIPAGAFVFIGSSTIRLWESMSRDLAPRPVVNRGFGGAVVSQALHYVDRLVPASDDVRAIVFYCGGNDMAWGVGVDTVVDQTERFIALAKQRAPSARFYLLSVGKTPSRWLSWRRVDRLNEKLEALAQRTGSEWVDISKAMQNERGRPVRSLYRFDGIHPSESGYGVWTRVLRERFDRDFGAA